MEKHKHTPEPWDHERRGTRVMLLKVGATASTVIGDFTAFKDANRARECVNACAGISNPAAIPAMVETLKWIAGYGKHSTPSRDENGIHRAQELARVALAALKGSSERRMNVKQAMDDVDRSKGRVD